MTRGQWDGVQDFMVQQKLMERPIDGGTLFTTELIERANRIDLAPVLRRAREAA
jgi:hypothetical protein